MLFGGSGAFINDIDMKDAYNDLWIWDTVKNDQWREVIGKGKPPKRRMHQGGTVLGGVMLIMGGVNTVAKTVLDDFILFDFGSETWI